MDSIVVLFVGKDSVPSPQRQLKTGYIYIYICICIMMMIINYYYCYTDHCVCKGVVEFLPHPSPVWLLEGFRVQGLGV